MSTIKAADPTLPDDVILAVEKLEVCFASQGRQPIKAVNGISFTIARGETLVLVGESGSGKSVTAMTIMRLTEHDGAKITGGRILMRLKDGKVSDLTKLSLKGIELLRGYEMSIVFQDPMSSLNPVFTIGDQIAEAIIRHQGKTKHEARDIALGVLKLVRVPDAARRLDQYAHQLSGGMRQRVMIAMALACRPSLMILDEPTTALDVTIQAQILDLVRALQREIGMSVLFITHDMGVVAEIADRVCVMLKGDIVETGSVYEIFAAPKHPYTQALISVVPRLGKADRVIFGRLEGEVPALGEDRVVRQSREGDLDLGVRRVAGRGFDLELRALILLALIEVEEDTRRVTRRRADGRPCVGEEGVELVNSHRARALGCVDEGATLPSRRVGQPGRTGALNPVSVVVTASREDHRSEHRRDKN